MSYCDFCHPDNLLYIPDFDKTYKTAIECKPTQIVIDNHNRYCLALTNEDKEIVKCEISYCPKCGSRLTSNNYHILNLIKNAVAFHEFKQKDFREVKQVLIQMLDLPVENKNTNILLSDFFSFSNSIINFTDGFFKRNYPFIANAFEDDEQGFIDFIVNEIPENNQSLDKINNENKEKLVLSILQAMEDSKEKIQMLLMQENN